MEPIKSYRPNVLVLKEKNGTPTVLQVSGKFYTLLAEYNPAPKNSKPVKKKKRHSA